MNLDEVVLQKLDDWSPPGDGRQTLAFIDADSGTSLQLAIDHLEKLSTELWEITVTRSAETVASEKSLKHWADRVASRVTGMMEPLKVIEVDNDLGRALLRSEEPAKKSDDRFYYEALLHRTGTASVRRYRGSKLPTKREQVSFTLTREAVAKLVADIAAAG